MQNIEEMKVILLDPELYTSYWFEKEGSNPRSFSHMILAYSKEIRALNAFLQKNAIRPLNDKILQHAYDVKLEQIPLERRLATKDAFKCSLEALEPLKTWIRAVTGKCQDDDLYVVAHWIWMVKKRLNEQDIVHHIMPIVLSPKQGGGKSTAVRKLYQPLELLTIELKVKQAVDERAYTLFNNYLIGFFDEMAGADKIDVNDLKSTLSSETLSYRPMRTNTQAKIRNLCSFIGTSNNQIPDIIKDTTGIRRFFPLFAQENLDHAAINTLDYVALWKGVDERLERGYFEKVKIEVNAKQADMQVKDELQVFLEERSLIAGPKDEKVLVNGKKLFREYQQYTINSGIRFPLAAQTFYRKLKDLGITAEYKRDETRAMTWFFELNKEAVFLNHGSVQ